MDQMQNAYTEIEPGRPSTQTGKEDSELVVNRPMTRSTRQSVPTYVHRELSPDRWTSRNLDWRKRWPRSLIFPATGKNRATVDQKDIERLDEGTFLNDNLIHFYIQYLQHQIRADNPKLLDRVYMFNTFFFEKLRSSKGNINYDGVKGWTAKFDLLAFDYIVVPVNEQGHWYLAIVCNAPNALDDTSEGQKDAQGSKGSSPKMASIERSLSDITIGNEAVDKQSVDDELSAQDPINSMRPLSGLPDSSTPNRPSVLTPTKQHDPLSPRIVVMDSLGASHPATTRALKDYLIAEAREKKGVGLATLPRGMTAKGLPQQNNGCDCGLFMLGYLQNFLKDPDESLRQIVHKEPPGWDLDPSRLRNQMRELLFELQQEQEERTRQEKPKNTSAGKGKATATATAAGASPQIQSARPEPEHPGEDSAPPPPKAVASEVVVSSPEVSLPDGIELDDNDDSLSLTLHGEPDEHQVPNDSPPDRTRFNLGFQRSPIMRNETRQTIETQSSMDTKEDDLKMDQSPTTARGAAFVATLSSSSQEQEVVVIEASPARSRLYETEPTDDEDVTITLSTARKKRPRHISSSPDMVDIIKSSQSASSQKPEASYDGIAKSVDLT